MQAWVHLPEISPIDISTLDGSYEQPVFEMRLYTYRYVPTVATWSLRGELSPCFHMGGSSFCPPLPLQGRF